MRRTRLRQVPKTNAVVYCRVSTEEQVGNQSLKTQEQRSLSHCSHMGWPVVHIFRDEGVSAKTTQREEFQKMLHYCKDPVNRVGYVVVNDLSRFSRNTNDLITVRAVLYEAGVALRSVSESIDETSTGNFVTVVFGAIHQLDNDRKSERTKAGMQAAAAIGRWPHKAPIGYLNVVSHGDGPNIIPDPERAHLVKTAFELAATGLHSKAETLRRVTQLGLRTAKGTPLPPQTFQKMLLNPFYAGWMVFPAKDVRLQGNFEALIDQTLFDRVQDALTGKRPNLTGYERNRADFPLRLFVLCAACGTPLTASWSTGRKQKYAYYRCRKSDCYSVKTPPEKLHALFLDWLGELAPEPQTVTAIKDSIRTVWKQREGDAEQLRAVLRRKLKQAETRKVTLVNRWLDNEVDPQTYREQVARLTAEIDDVRGELRNTEMENIELERVLEFADKIIQRPALLWVESSLEQRQRLQKTLFPSGIDFDGKRFGTAETPLFFNLLSSISDTADHLASPTGFEPVLSP